MAEEEFTGFTGFGIEDMDPQQVQEILGLAGMDEESAALIKQLELAQAMRGTTAPEMRGNYRVQAAASPLEHMGRILQMAGGKYGKEGTKKTRERQEEVRAAQQAARQAYLLRNRGAAQQAPQPDAGMYSNQPDYNPRTI